MMINTIKKYLLPVIGVVIIITLLFINFSSTTFWNASFTEIITIGMAVFISFYLTEKLNDKRRRNECIEHIILELEQMMNEEYIFSIDKKKSFMYQRSCANRIKYLKDANFQDIREDINFIANEIETIKDLYSNHNQNKKSLEAHFADFDKHRNLICDKCNKIRIGLYVY